MKKFAKKLLAFAGVAFTAVALTSCTKSFCSVQDRANNMANYEKTNLEKINKEAEKNGYLIAQPLFNKFIELKVDAYIEEVEQNANGEPFAYVSTGDDAEEALAYKRNISKFAGLNEKGKNELWYNYDKWYAEFINLPAPTNYTVGDEQTMTEITFGGPAYAPTRAYVNYYKKTLANAVANNRACLTPESGIYGQGSNQVYIEGKTWKQAFTEYGPIEGLLVYPIGCLLHYLTKAFGTSGWGQVAAILIVTLIVRVVIIAATFSSTLSQSRMSELKPELDALQNKYPHSNTNQYEKQQLAQEQMKLYKKNKIHPFRQILVMFIQFPVFIAVWGAMQGSAILTQGSVFGLQLTTVTSNAIMAANSETPFAIVLIIMMSIAQFISSKLPTWFQNWKGKKYSTVTVKNEAVEKQSQSMKMMSTVMLVVIIFMGFTLPAAMGIYWFIGAIISIAQTLIMEAVQTHNRHKSGKGPGAKISNRPNSIIRRGKKL